jgi:hypothetical protein
LVEGLYLSRQSLQKTTSGGHRTPLAPGAANWNRLSFCIAAVRSQAPAGNVPSNRLADFAHGSSRRLHSSDVILTSQIPASRSDRLYSTKASREYAAR